MSGSFFDTNILIYAVSADATKAERAVQLVQDGGTISVRAAALLCDCDTLSSEDMQHDMRIEDALTIRNPFRV